MAEGRAAAYFGKNSSQNSEDGYTILQDLGGYLPSFEIEGVRSERLTSFLTESIAELQSATFATLLNEGSGGGDAGQTIWSPIIQASRQSEDETWQARGKARKKSTRKLLMKFMESATKKFWIARRISGLDV